MNQDQTAFVEFMQWLCEQTDIPLQTRRDLVAHIRSNRGLDQKSVQFIDQYLARRSAQAHQAETYETKVDETFRQLLSLESNPETSLKTRVANEAIADMEQLADHFKANVKGYDLERSQAAESKITDADQAAVAALKAQL